MQLGLINKLGSSSLQGALLNPWIRSWWNNLKADSGEVQRISDVNSYYNMCVRNDIADSIEFGMLGGYNLRTKGSTKYITKAYSFDSVPNDATQTTESSQPYLTGNIAPNEHWGIKNPNEDDRYLTHPGISFATNEPWTVTTVVCWDGDPTYSFVDLYGTSLEFGFQIRYGGSNTIRIVSDDDVFSITTPNSSLRLIGKNTVISLAANGDDSLLLYIDGILFNSFPTLGNRTSATFSKLNEGRTVGVNASSTISAHIIRSQALAPEQVAAEAAYLQTIYPEIPTVNIGSSSIASSNIDVVASTNGTIITEAIDNADWATGAARWCYYSDDSNIGSWAGKLYNKAARDVIIANPPSGYHVATEAELTALAALGGNVLKHGGTDYWNTTGGTNSTGFTALGGSSRNADGTFNTIKDSACFWCADSDKVLKVYHNNNTAEVVAVASVNEGFSIRLIKD